MIDSAIAIPVIPPTPWTRLVLTASHRAFLHPKRSTAMSTSCMRMLLISANGLQLLYLGRFPPSLEGNLPVRGWPALARRRQVDDRSLPSAGNRANDQQEEHRAGDRDKP